MTTSTAKVTDQLAPTPYKKLISQSLFFLAAYSLTGAAMMGSSIGLVVYQSRQFFFLNRSSLHHYSYSHRYGLGEGAYQDDSGLIHPAKYDQLHAQHHHEHHHTSHLIRSFVFSSWLPVLVWFVSLVLSTILFRIRKTSRLRGVAIFPEIVSARTGVLLSQFVFTMFWVMLGGIQEVQERLVMAQKGDHSSFSLSPPLDLRPIVADAMDDWVTDNVMVDADSSLTLSLELLSSPSSSSQDMDTRNLIMTMAIPLCMLWYLAVTLLGAATGLLAVSSSLLEKQLAHAYQQAGTQAMCEQAGRQHNQEDLDEKAVRDQVLIRMHDTKTVAMVSATTVGTVETTDSRHFYTTRQRAALALLILSLSLIQMRVFWWIDQAQSTVTYDIGAGTPVSLYLTIVGAMFGAIMLGLGIQFLPRILPRVENDGYE
ncbi:hypothetical protein BGZ99_008270 [Dissophora globulifera]|uniref:Transmembrane protein n=1 Tax=Dissophora globulifera TaxID=979702 RepID=A0A9P6UPZ9_9FUNG|nr:hypothetical protein BGZ99_008270 [Dissophora globulifera]